MSEKRIVRKIQGGNESNIRHNGNENKNVTNITIQNTPPPPPPRHPKGKSKGK